MNGQNSPLFNFNELFIWCLFLAFTGLRDARNKWRQFWCVKRPLNSIFISSDIYSAVHVSWRRRNEIYCGEIFFKPFSLSFLTCSLYKLLNFMYFSSRLVKKDNRERFWGSMNFSVVSITTITSFIKRQQIFPLLFIVIIIIKLNEHNLFIQTHVFICSTHKNCQSNYYLFGIYWHCFNSSFCQIIICASLSSSSMVGCWCYLLSKCLTTLMTQIIIFLFSLNATTLPTMIRAFAIFLI